MTHRLEALENKLGAHVPADYAAFLKWHRAVDEPDCYVSSNPDYWGVRSLFELGVGDRHFQLDEVLRLVADAIPAGTLAILAHEQSVSVDQYLAGVRRGVRLG